MDTEPVEGTDGLIHVMPAPLANQIAAGEVVQRPASVAKECIENALDAGASSVELIIKKAGSELVQVVDDGCGMSRPDARRCFERHATSKIRHMDDLEQIRTLGFRGEALASIGAVAQVELRTKRAEDEMAFRVDVEGSEIACARPCAASNGTSIAVRNLFFNVPARRNFLKTPATEFKHLTETFQKLALSNPDVAFRMVHNGNEIYRLPAESGSWQRALTRRILQLFGEQHADELIWVEDEGSYVALEGAVGAPEFHRRGNEYQFLFVNGRCVHNRYLAHAVRRAYENMLPDGAFPFFALFLSLDPSRVDVNVHPAKEEVKFDDQQGLYAFMRAAVKDALSGSRFVPRFAPDEEARETGDGASVRRFIPSFPASPRDRGRSADRSTEDPHAVTRALYDFTPVESDSESNAAARPGGEGPAADRLSGSPCWQVGRAYIVLPSSDGLTLIDQRAAHKRVIYEQSLRTASQEAIAPQALLFPKTVDVSVPEFELFEEVQPLLQKMGVDAEPFGEQTIVIRGVPPGIEDDRAGDFLEQVLSDLRNDLLGQAQEEQEKKIARALARGRAIRRGQRMEVDEMQALVSDLFDCAIPYTDPEGNPSLARLSPTDIAGLLTHLGS